VSGADWLKKHLHHCVSVDIIETSGHAVYMDAPTRLAMLIDLFAFQ